MLRQKGNSAKISCVLYSILMEYAGSSRSQADTDRKFNEYLASLRKQIKIEDDSEKAVEQYMTGQDLGLTPVPPQYKSVQEQNQDVIRNRQIALENLKSIMDANEAQAVLNNLTDDRIWNMNSSWTNLTSELKGRKNIDSTFFNAFLRRFEQKLASTGDTGIDMGNTELSNVFNNFTDAQSQRLEAYIDRKATQVENATANRTLGLQISAERYKNQILQALATASPLTYAQAKQLIDDQTKELGDITKVTSAQTRDLVRTSIQELQANLTGQLGNINRSVINTHNEVVNLAGDAFISQGELGEAQTLIRQQLNNLDQLVQTHFSYTADTQAKLDILLKDTYKIVQRTESFEDLVQLEGDILNAIVELQQMPVSTPPTKILKLPLRVKTQAVRRSKRERKQTLVYNPATGQAQAPNPSTAPSGLARNPSSIISNRSSAGKGLANRNQLHTRRHIIGRGIEPQQKELYRHFGNWVIHMPSLKKGILNLKFKSLHHINHVPQQPISADLVEFILDVLESGKMNQAMYKHLSEVEKKLFSKIAKMAQIDEVLGISGGSVDDEMDEIAKRFQLVRGEVMAGNDNEEVLNELKRLTLRLATSGKISKSAAHSLLVELACVT